MSNTKGNQYPMWYIDNNYEVFALDHGGKSHSMSSNSFAYDIGVSEDGTVWVVSSLPDSDGGGARIFWSNGDGNWNEIATSDPGGIRITGYTGSSCLFLTSNDEVYSLDTNGTATLEFQNLNIILLTYGGGYLWSLMPEQAGGIPVLRYLDIGSGSKTWNTFAGNVMPSSISADYAGNCAAVVNFSPVTYSKDGSSSYSAGAGIDGKALQISFRNWCFAVSTDANQDGNLIYEWQDESGGTFMATAARGSVVESSYYTA